MISQRHFLERWPLKVTSSQKKVLTLDINLEEKIVELFAENIIIAGKSFLSQPMEKPFIPSWQRIEYASPGFTKKLRKAVSEDNE